MLRLDIATDQHTSLEGEQAKDALENFSHAELLRELLLRHRNKAGVHYGDETLLAFSWLAAIFVRAPQQDPLKAPVTGALSLWLIDILRLGHDQKLFDAGRILFKGEALGVKERRFARLFARLGDPPEAERAPTHVKGSGPKSMRRILYGVRTVDTRGILPVPLRVFPKAQDLALSPPKKGS